ncbi:MAG: MFS transporter [Bacillaceae bacterium]|nr:MFS transporter [Bacillaceae bacterium]
MWPLVTLYVHNELHRSYGDAGLVLLLQSLAGIVGQFTGGSLFHRLGPRILIIGSLVLTGMMQILLVFAGWPEYVLLMVLLGFLVSVTMPAINAFIGFKWKKERSRLFNVVYVSNNIGVALGTSLSGLIATYSFQLTFLLNGLSTFAFAIYFYVLMKHIRLNEPDTISFSHDKQSVSLPVGKLLWNYKIYLFLGLGSLLIWFSTSQWGSGVAPYLDENGYSLAAFSFLWTLNGIIILIGQPLISLLKKTLSRTLTAQLVASAIFYATGYTYIYLFHHDYVQFMIGMIITTFGEMLIAPAVPTFITEKTGLAAPFYLGVVGAIGSTGRLLGPYIYGNLYDLQGAEPIFLLTVLLSSLAVISFLIHAVLNTSPSRETSIPSI